MTRCFHYGIAVAFAALLTTPALAAETSRTIGLVLTDWHLAIPEVEGNKDCPDGFHYDNNEQWAAQFPTEAAQRAHIAKYYHRQNRGPNGENAWYNPTSATDPLPFRELQSKIAYGMNLDGTSDGRATERTCKHQKFTEVNGAPAVDNQMYRVFGCQKGMRKTGFFDEFHNTSIRTDPVNRILIEVSDVDDEMNDPEVTVRTYKGQNKLVEDASGNVLPWQSQRVDERLSPFYASETRGKIENGVLITEPVDIKWQHKLGITAPNHYQINRMQLRLKLHEKGARGIMAGYYDIAQYWEVFSKNAVPADWLARTSGPSTYAAFMRYADGDKDPGTGQCMSISMAQDVGFARAFIIHPSKESQAPALASAAGAQR